MLHAPTQQPEPSAVEDDIIPLRPMGVPAAAYAPPPPNPPPPSSRPMRPNRTHAAPDGGAVLPIGASMGMPMPPSIRRTTTDSVLPALHELEETAA